MRVTGMPAGAGPPARLSGENVRAALLLLGVAALLAWFMRPMWDGRVYTSGDLGQFHLPLRHFYADCLRSGDAFEWIPYVWTGFYLHGEGQVGMYHPAHYLLYCFFPLDWAFNLELLLSYPFAVAGMYLWLRGRGLPRDAAVLAGGAFITSGFITGHSAHLNGVAIATHAPWLLWAIDRVGSDRPGGKALGRLALGLLVASQLLLGYPQYVLLNAFVVGLYLCLVVRGWRAWRDVVVASALGALAGAVQLLPTWEALRDSVRAAPTADFRGWFSLHPYNLFQFTTPLYLVVDERCECLAYGGLLAAVGLAWVLIRRGRLGEGGWPLGRFALAVFGLGLFLAPGMYNPLFPHYSAWPPFSFFRCPSRNLFLCHFAGAVAGGLFWADLTRAGRPARVVGWRVLGPLCLLPALCLAPYALEPLIETARQGAAESLPRWKLYRLDHAWVGPAFLFTSALTLLLVLAGRGCRWVVPLVLGLFAVDLWLVHRTVPLEPATLSEYADRVPRPPVPDGELAGGRVFQPEFHNGLCLRGIGQVAGYLALPTPRKLDCWHEATHRVAGVRWKCVGGAWSPVEGALPRVRLVARALHSEVPGWHVQSLDCRSAALVPFALPLDRRGAGPTGGPGEVTVLADRPGMLRVRARAPSQQVLVFSESFHRGWRVWLDGGRHAHFPVYGDFLGCVVPAGEHEVRFSFQPRSLVYGKRLSLLGLAGMLGWLAWGWFFSGRGRSWIWGTSGS